MKAIRISTLVGLLAFATLWAAQREGSSSDAGSRKSQEPVLALKGLDPVSLVQGRNEEGEESFSAPHDGYRYYFANRKHRQAFQSDPDKYSVHPSDLVIRARLGVETKGKPDIFAVHRGKIYLFATEDTQKVFEQNPEEFLGAPQRRDSRPKPEGSHPEGSGPQR